MRGAFVLLKGRGPTEGMSRQAEGGLTHSRKMLRKVTRKTRLNHFLSKLNHLLSNMTNSMKVVDSVIQLTVSAEELAQNIITLGAGKLSEVNIRTMYT